MEVLTVLSGFTLIVTDPVKFCEQTGAVPTSILTKLYVVLEVRFPVARVAVPAEFR